MQGDNVLLRFPVGFPSPSIPAKPRSSDHPIIIRLYQSLYFTIRSLVTCAFARKQYEQRSDFPPAHSQCRALEHNPRSEIVWKPISERRSG